MTECWRHSLVFVLAKNSTDPGQVDWLGVQGTASFWVALRIAFGLKLVGVSTRRSHSFVSAKNSTDSGQVDCVGVLKNSPFGKR